jgi:hypothetical protein
VGEVITRAAPAQGGVRDRSLAPSRRSHRGSTRKC